MVLDHRVDVRPSVPVMRYVDYWGTEVSAFDVHEPHDRLIVAAPVAGRNRRSHSRCHRYRLGGPVR